MLQELERRIVTIVADTVADRAHLTVIGGPAPVTALAAGSGRIVARIDELAPDPGFLADATFESTAPPESRRILRLSATVRLIFQMRPATTSAADAADARGLLLEDMSIVGHALADTAIASGEAFQGPEDAGFRVLGFLLARGRGTLEPGPEPLNGELLYACDAEIWPPGPADEASIVAGVSTVLAALPVEGTSGERVVAAGRPATITLRSLPRQRPLAAGRPATPLRLALRVLSPAPAAARGTITTGTAGAEPGVTLLPVSDPETSIVYQAPAALADGARTEYVAVHYATADGKAGLFLGSVAVRITGGA